MANGLCSVVGFMLSNGFLKMKVYLKQTKPQMVPKRYVILKISTTFWYLEGVQTFKTVSLLISVKTHLCLWTHKGMRLLLHSFFCSFRHSWQGSCQLPLLGWDFFYWSVTYCSLKMGDTGLWQGGNTQVFSFVLIKFWLWMYDTLALVFFHIFSILDFLSYSCLNLSP